MDFYRELARNGRDDPGNLRSLRQWPGPEAPKFYIKTTDDTGRVVIGQGVVDKIATTIRTTVPAITDGRYTPAVIESGLEDRPPTVGWIRILIEELVEGAFCGNSFVGANPGTIRLAWGGRCSCSGERIHPGVVAHELGHAMGFWHISELGVMTGRGLFCTTGTSFSSQESFHTQVTYRRPRLNTDLDNDPTSAALSHLSAPEAVSCFPAD